MHAIRQYRRYLQVHLGISSVVGVGITQIRVGDVVVLMKLWLQLYDVRSALGGCGRGPGHIDPRVSGSNPINTKCK